MQDFIDASFGAVNIAGTAKNTAQSSAFLLKQNTGNKQGCKHNLHDIKNRCVHN